LVPVEAAALFPVQEAMLEPKEVIRFLPQLLQLEVDYLLVVTQVLVKPVALAAVVVV
jgi:hypothetical protein